MFLTKLKVATAVLLVVGALAAGVAASLPRAGTQEAEGQKPAEQKKDEAVKAPPKPADLQRRIGELEKKIQSLTGELKGLRKDLKAVAARPADKGEVRIFSLSNADAAEVAKTLEPLFITGPWTAPQAASIRISTHPSTNTLILRGSQDDLEVAEVVIKRLDEQPKKKKEAATSEEKK